MEYISTRGGVSGLTFSEAVMMGLATDGGLLLPDSIPEVSSQLDDWQGLSYSELAAQVMAPYVDDIGETDLASLISRSYASFDHASVSPLVEVGDIHVLELFHGPTLAFKDIALQLLGNLFGHVLSGSNSKLNILGATSGDTGSAAIAGLRGKPGINTFIMFPDGRTSPVQELQMTTVLDKNVFNIAIDGSFDDCQSLMKTVFSDLQFKSRYSLGAVNSVNWARVLAQIVYYFSAWYQLQRPSTFDVAVPTGNFGNIFAGFIAKKMGLPIRKLILATNSNDILARFFNSGVYQKGSVHFSESPAMDIQIASNFERLLYYHLGEDGQQVGRFMRDFQTTGLASVPGRNGIMEYFDAGSVNDTDTLQGIKKCYQAYGYLADPHTAVGICREEQILEPGVPMVCLATAHPAKFEAAVHKAMPSIVPRHAALENLQGLETRKFRLPASDDHLRAFIAEHCPDW
jgi:threonine synthase